MLSDNLFNLKRTYKNSIKGEKIGRDLIVPCLSECKTYRRGTGTFTSSILKTYLESIEHILDDDVKIEILCSPKIDNILFQSIKTVSDEKKKAESIQNFLDNFIYDITGVNKNPQGREFKEQLLCYLIAKKILEIRFAVPIKDADIEALVFNEAEEQTYDNLEFRNMYHIKQGYFKFKDGETIAFEGSVNETDTALSFNQEKARVFKSWDDKHREDLKEIVDDIDKDWGDLPGNKNENIRIYPIGEKLIKLINDRCPIERPKNPDEPHKSKGNKNSLINPTPRPKEKLEIKLWPHQVEAIKNWEDNEYKGIFAMATGSGKTITAISGINKIRDRDSGSLILIVVPLRNLAKQWIMSLEESSFKTVGVSSDYPGWETKIQDEVFEARVVGDAYKGPIIVAVEDSFKLSKFQNLLEKFSNIDMLDKLIIIDECHHFNKKEQLKKLPEFFNYRMGLSATPFNRYDEEKNELYLLEYFDKVVITYTLKEAIDDKFLTPYNYHIVPVTMNSVEIEKLLKINQQLAIAIDNFDDELRNILAGKKVRLLASIEDKMIKLEELIRGNKRHYALAYCGAASDEDDEGDKIRIIEKVARIFANQDWQVGRISAEESMKERQQSIRDLEQKLKHVIVSIRVLDEGIDIPCLQTAYILSSSKDDKQFIQRRGRVLRTDKASGKEFADIYDFAILGAESSTDGVEDLVKEEFYRINEFAKCALNKEVIYRDYKKELEDYARD